MSDSRTNPIYFLLRCLLPHNDNGEALVEIHNCFELGSVWDWLDGQPLSAAERDFPVPVRIDFDTFRGYVGPPVELRDVCIPLMSRRMGDAILAAGVENIELFPAVLRNKQSGVEYEYYVYKVIGKVAAADLKKSEWISYDGKLDTDVGFETLVLNEPQARGLLMFRLAENVGALVAHEKVCKSIAAHGVTGVEFVRPEDWFHL